MILLTSFLFLASSSADELMKLKNLNLLGTKHAKSAVEKFEKLYQEQPKLKYYMQPSKRDLLKKLRQKKR